MGSSWNIYINSFLLFTAKCRDLFDLFHGTDGKSEA